MIDIPHPTRVSLTNLVSEGEDVRAKQTGAPAELRLPGLVHTDGSVRVAILWTLFMFKRPATCAALTLSDARDDG
jgi:hypothetical protein